MRRVGVDFAVIGSGGAAMLAALRLAGEGDSVALINPEQSFGIEDLRLHHGLGIWNAAYRGGEEASLSGMYETLVSRMREIFPGTLEQSGLSRGEHWSILSATPVHRAATESIEREYLKLERKAWCTGQVRLVNPEHVDAQARKLGMDLSGVAQVEGAVVRSCGLWWDAPRMGLVLSQLVRDKFPAESGPASCRLFAGASIEGRHGRRLLVTTQDGEETGIEARRALLVFLTGDLLPLVRNLVASCGEPWIQGVRKRRREQHFAWFGGRKGESEPVWLELGHTRYRWAKGSGHATWRSAKGPDGLEHVVDEGLRLARETEAGARFTRATRSFRLDWEWKGPAWRETRHSMRWATAFEGDPWSVMEILWTLPGA